MNDANLLKHEDKMRKQNENLIGATKVIYEAQGVAQDIEINLGDQNTRAQKSQNEVRGMQSLLGESDSIITRMTRRENILKLVLSGIGVLIVMAVLFILYSKLFK